MKIYEVIQPVFRSPETLAKYIPTLCHIIYLKSDAKNGTVSKIGH